MRGTRRGTWILAATCSLLAACQDEAVVGNEAQEVTREGKSPQANECRPERWRTDRPDPGMCCEDGNRTWAVFGGTRLAMRTFANPCTEADGVSTNCAGTTGVACVYGPCGARIEWSVDADAAYVFKPTSKPGTCGWAVQGVRACTGTQCGDDRGWPLGVDRQHPEPYAGQELWGGLEPACEFRVCVAGGVPGL